MRVNVYLDTDSRYFRKAGRWYGFRLEAVCARKTEPKEDYEYGEVTYNQAIIIALLNALRRFGRGCEMHIYTDNRHVMNTFNNHLPNWAENGWKQVSVKGQQCMDEWMYIWHYARYHEITWHPGPHDRSELMQQEMEKRSRQ